MRTSTTSGAVSDDDCRYTDDVVRREWLLSGQEQRPVSEPMRVSYRELYDVLLRALGQTRLEPQRAALCARLFAETSRDGVYSHGLNRFPRFFDAIRSGLVDVQAEPQRVSTHGVLERWDGRRGPGNLNAYACMERAIEVSREHGIGCVALANTNHWMRGGTYGWQAADAGVIGICWTNTMPNLPPWGLSEPRLGNNPIVIAVPRPEGAVVLDTAMSQFSFGALSSYRMRGEMLPVAGGFDAGGELTRDPAAIETSGRALPIGFWKGSGLALMLDMVAALLSGGHATHEVPATPETESELSQVFLAFRLPSPGDAGCVVNAIVEHLLAPSRDGARARYPGERTLETRRRNLQEGIPVEPSVWRTVQAFGNPE
jgi:3-dehydro-L-gulonate 2-dehydrogenase